MNNYYQLRNKIEKLIKRCHLKNFVKKDTVPGNRLEKRRELVKERAVRLMNDKLSEIINMIIREEAIQPL